MLQAGAQWPRSCSVQTRVSTLHFQCRMPSANVDTTPPGGAAARKSVRVRMRRGGRASTKPCARHPCAVQRSAIRAAFMTSSIGGCGRGWGGTGSTGGRSRRRFQARSEAGNSMLYSWCTAQRREPASAPQSSEPASLLSVSDPSAPAPSLQLNRRRYDPPARPWGTQEGGLVQPAAAVWPPPAVPARPPMQPWSRRSAPADVASRLRKRLAQQAVEGQRRLQASTTPALLPHCVPCSLHPLSAPSSRPMRGPEPWRGGKAGAPSTTEGTADCGGGACDAFRCGVHRPPLHGVHGRRPVSGRATGR